MNRKNFIKSTLTAAATLTTGGLVSTAKAKESDLFLEQVGFNHLPIVTTKTMNTLLHKSNTRGHANHGWLNSYHSFSFANYYDPSRMNFGALRVLNDDVVDGGKGFGRHPHENMEIISIPLSGDLEHKDSTGTAAVIKQNDVQIMSAGTGIFHSEYNKNADKKVNFLQIWVFPKEENIQPRYEQKTFNPEDRVNKLQEVVSAKKGSEGVWINQDAWFHLGTLKKDFTTDYNIKQKGNGVYTFVIDGEVTVNGQLLNKRDGFGVWDTDKISVIANSDTELLLIEVPMD